MRVDDAAQPPSPSPAKSAGVVAMVMGATMWIFGSRFFGTFWQRTRDVKNVTDLCSWTRPNVSKPALAPAPCFSPTTRQSGAGAGAATDSDDDAADLTSDPTGPPDSPARTTAAITTAKCSIDYNVDWDCTEGAADPCLAAVALLGT